MRKLTIWFLFLAAAVSHSRLAAQAVEDTFFSQPKATDFNLPTVGVALKLPPNMGYKVSGLGNGAMLNINKGQVSYLFGNELIEAGEVGVQFSLPGENTSSLSLSVYNSHSRSQSEYVEDLKRSEYFSRELEPVRTKMGYFQVVELISDGGNVYIYLREELEFVYIFFSNSADKQCKKVVESIQKKAMPEALKVYEQQQSKSLDRKLEKEKYENTEDLKKYNGSFDVPTTVSFVPLGMSLLIPEEFTYEFDAQRMLQQNGEVEATISEGVLATTSFLFARFNNSKLYFHSRIAKETDSPEQLVKADMKSGPLVKQFKLQVDGVPFEAVAIGHKEQPTITLYGQVNGYGVCLLFMMVDEQTLPLVEQLIDGIHFSAMRKEGHTITPNTFPPITQQLVIAKRQQVQLKNITFTKPKAEFTALRVYHFADLGISASLPINSSEYVSPDNVDGVEKEEDGLRIYGHVEKEGNSFISVSGSYSALGENYSVIVSPADVSLDEYADVVVKQWAGFSMIDMKRTGKGSVNGQEWVLMEYIQAKSTYGCRFTTIYEGVVVTFSCMVDKKNFRPGFYESLLYGFRFGK